MSVDPRFAALREALSAYASDPEDPPPTRSDFLQAAVALVVRAGDPLEVLLIKRAKREGDPWSGHMALPGGRRDARDDTLLDTAVRETIEEIGLDLRDLGVHLGRLDVVRPVSPHLPRMSITPHVFGVPAETMAAPASAEVDAVHWASLDVLRHPATRGRIEIRFEGGAQTFPGLHVAGDIVWGLTFRILEDFLGRAPEVFPLPRDD